MTTTLEREAATAVAAEYEGKGYRVYVNPTAIQLPAFLQGWQPDVLAVSGAEQVVIEIKKTADLRDPALARIAQEIARHPGWRFELVVTNPPSSPEVPTDQRLISEVEVANRLANASTLAASGMHQAALLLAWSAAEAVLRRLADRNGLESARKGSSYLIKELYSLGVIEESDFSLLGSALQARNSLTHGFAGQSVDQALIDRLVRAVERLSSKHDRSDA